MIKNLIRVKLNITRRKFKNKDQKMRQKIESFLKVTMRKNETNVKRIII